jgi:cytoplasmic iron level regulating protein YaaA (DUF328/UPF0246 family)
VRAVRSLARDPEATQAALGLGPRQRAEIERNRALTVSATMPAIDRYTGVLYDALDASSLPEQARAFAGAHVAIHSALFGLIGALDPIPAYRLSHNSKIPDVPLKKHWSASVTSVLGTVTGPVLDFRSEAYVALGPVPAGVETVFLRVVTKDAEGQKRALNHFNKASKGALTRALSRNAQDFASVDALLEWAAGSGFALYRGAPGELELSV